MFSNIKQYRQLIGYAVSSKLEALVFSQSILNNNLKQNLADYGFESHEDYGFVVQQLMANNGPSINCLSLTGNSGRRKTAFAHALGNALAFKQTFYHDFSQLKAPEPLLDLPEPEDKTIAKEKPISALNRLVSDACAYSEAENTLLIFDQLQLCDFRHQITIHQLLTDNIWRYPKNEFAANPHNLTVCLISENDLYHSLQKSSFKVWISNASYNKNLATAKELKKDPTLQPVLDGLADIFKLLKVTPTQSELLKLINDIETKIHTVSDLTASLYGWIEGVDYLFLQKPSTQNRLINLIPIIDSFLGIDQLEILE